MSDNNVFIDGLEAVSNFVQGINTSGGNYSSKEQTKQINKKTKRKLRNLEVNLPSHEMIFMLAYL